MDPMERTRLLCQDIRESEEYRTYARYKDEIREEEIFLPLRMIWGLDIAAFAKKYGV